MKKLAITLALLVAAGYVGWQNRLDLLLWAAPKLTELRTPVAPNQPVNWQQGPEVATQSPAERPPNIILILADDLGFNDISLTNGGAADGSLQTPSIDSLAAAGTQFTNGYAANAICAPSRASLMTGRYSSRFGFEYTPIFKLGPRIFQWMEDLEPSDPPVLVDLDVTASLPPMEELGMPAEEVTIAEALKQQGYYTAHIGKWHLGTGNGMRPEEQGFDDSLYMKGTLYQPADHPEVVNARVHGDAIDNMIWATGTYAAQFNGSEPFAPEGYLTDYYTREAVKVIEANRNQPFFLYLAHWGVHNPLQASRADYEALSHIKDHRLRVYAGMIRALDRSVAKINAALEEHGLSDNTLVIFSSDNGGAGYLGLPDLNKPYRGWKLSHFEGGTHVPFLMRWPAQIPAGGTVTEPAHHIDLFQTIAAAAGAPVPDDRKLDGIDLLPTMRGEVDANLQRPLFWRQGHQQSVLSEGWKLIRAAQPDKPGAGPQKFLFHLAADPTEQRDLSAEQPEKVAELEALLAAHNAEQVPPAWPSAMQAPILIDKTTNEVTEAGDTYLYWPN
ncbi:sulfatase-like hydrolase/transferase [Microbulbifer agarilyticus]|uniref:sulfatase-like hydrolase/transferase n=1 Tax=Microbulbifer agarilyticus TaxID=260552 RepID=UPI001C956BE4|nr:sulfatase-like hydrolase/transferase [Microbulbifer agarilyticus]MBY6191100.1 sulfatase-like hydrolase/transferase [Microbulbifer agarilyticus]